MPADYALPRTWWTRGRPFTLGELIADGVVHGIGLAVALGLGTALIVGAVLGATPDIVPALALYVATLVLLLSISLAFNLCPIHLRAKRTLARLDQAAIFLFIAGSYTPFLALLGPGSTSLALAATVWGAALLGALLKLTVPHRFGRIALVMYLGIGWSGVLVIAPLAATLPPMALWLVVAGGITYSAGVIFHVWEKLKFHNAVWHAFVVTGATLQLLAVLDSVVLSPLA